jgi:hypothetical protein|tara:strand:- start:2186 stop:3193 length:1008 start_codon:yes stop_codon:yes gene_type:complete
MAYQTGDLILDDHYNGFANTNDPNNINKIWGVGNGTYGMGQSNVISVVDTSTTVQASQWNSLLGRMRNLSDHQGTAITTADSGTLTAGDPVAAILAITNDITALGNGRYTAAAANITDANSAGNRTFSGAWRTSTVHEQTITFASSDAARYFFNAGGSITHTWNLSGGTAGAKQTEWVDLFNTKAATFTLTGNDDVLSGSGTPGTDVGAGYWNASLSNGGAYVVLQKQFADTSPYTANFCQWEVKISGTAGSNGGKGEVLHIKATASDAAVDSSDEGTGGTGEAESDPEDDAQTLLDSVDGTLTSVFVIKKPNTTHLNNDAIGTVTGAEASQSQA